MMVVTTLWSCRSAMAGNPAPASNHTNPLVEKVSAKPAQA